MSIVELIMLISFLISGFGIVIIAMFPNIFNGLRLRAKKITKSIDKAVNDPVATADERIDEAKHKVEEFKSKVRELRKELIKNETKLPGLKAEVTKWESIYIKASKSNSNDAGEAALELKRADNRLKSVSELVNTTRSTIESLSQKITEYNDRLENVEVVKDTLLAKKAHADLRADAVKSGELAENGLGALKSLEEACQDAEAEATALEQEAGNSGDNLASKYGTVDSEFDERLKKLLD